MAMQRGIAPLRNLPRPRKTMLLADPDGTSRSR
jgi:hypothetical protein